MVVVPAVAMPAVRVPLNFYKTEAGNEPVLEWLRSLPVNERRAIGRELKEAQIGWPIGMPLCRPLGAGLYEIRTRHPDKITRVFVCFADGALVALHARKRSQWPISRSLENV